MGHYNLYGVVSEKNADAQKKKCFVLSIRKVKK